MTSKENDMDKQLFTEGDTIKQGGQVLECSFVTYRDRDDKRENYTYSFRLKSELDKERKESKGE